MLKKVISCFIALCMTVPTFSAGFAAEAESAPEREFYVSVDGSDDGDGTKAHPFKTVDRARLEVQKYNKDMHGDIVVNIGDGGYQLDSTLNFGVEDSGSNGYDVVYKGNRDNVPTLSGGRTVTGWSDDDGDGIWTTTVDADYIRYLYVNDHIAMRAKTTKLVYGDANYKDPNLGTKTSDGFYADKGKIGLWENPEDIELFWGVAWKSFAMKVEDIVEDPSNSNRVIVKMEDPWDETSVQTSTFLPQQPSWRIGFMVENAYELLDEPGEFYYNKNTKVLSYIPREGQDMTTAEVYYPVIERIIHFEGNGVNDKVHNIKFEDVRFAHTTWHALEYQFQYFNQVEHPQMPGASAKTTPGAVQLDWADNISIESCVFYGLAQVGLALAEGVTNGQFHGNVFTDIGCGAYLVGRKYHNTQEVKDYGDVATNVAFRKPTYMSYYRWGEFINPYHGGTAEFSTGIANIWRGDPNAEEKGELSWVVMDLEKEYTIDNIRISFENQGNYTVNDEEKSNFEVIVSNDPKFNDYDVLYTCRGKSDDVCIVQGNPDKKYRFVMVRKTVAELFAVSSMQVYSWDVPNLGGEQGLCSYNYFTNNYIQRVANRHLAAPGISTVFTNNCYIDNNEIYDVPYSAMSLGYLWNVGIRYETTHTIVARNNRLERYNMYCNDGGGIYTLCCMPNSELSGNYLKYCGNTHGSIYHDSSTGDFTDYNNVIENTPYGLFLNGATVQNLNIYNTYTDGRVRKDPTTGSTVEPENEFPAGTMPAEAYEIMINAGITDEYEYIKDRVPDGSITYPWGIDSQASYVNAVGNGGNYLESQDYGEFAKINVNKILENGTFGRLPWNYPIDSKYSLEYWMGRLTSLEKDFDADVASAEGSAYDMYEMRDVYDYATDSVTHLSADEMIEMCDGLIAAASTKKVIGGYPEAALKKFKNAVAEAKKMPQTTETEKYSVTLALEKAYQQVYDSCYRADIDYLYVDGGVTEMDYDNKNITVKVAANVDLNEIQPEFAVSDGAKIAVKLDTITFNKPMKVSVYNETVKKYNDWTVTFVRESLEPTGAVSPSLNPEDYSEKNPNSDVANVGGTIRFYQDYKVYADTKDVFDGYIKLNTKIGQPDSVDGVNFIISAQTGSNLEYGAYNEKNTYYNLAIKGQKIELSSVKGGHSSLCFSVDNIGFNYGEFNTVEVYINDSGNMDVVTVKVNGNIVANNAYADDIGGRGYFGVMSLNQTVILGE